MADDRIAAAIDSGSLDELEGALSVLEARSKDAAQRSGLAELAGKITRRLQRGDCSDCNRRRLVIHVPHVCIFTYTIYRDVIYMHKYTYIHIHIYIYIHCIHKYANVHVHVYIYRNTSYMRVCTPVCVNIHHTWKNLCTKFSYTCTHKYTYLHILVRIHVIENLHLYI